METQFTDDINEKVRSYLCNIKNEYIIHECELIHCINNEWIKKNIDTDIYVSFRDTIINVVEDFIIEKNMIEKKEEESFSYEQKFRDLKIRLRDRSWEESRRLDKKYNDHFNILFNYYKKCTEKILFRFEKRKKNIIQCINSKYCIYRTLPISKYNYAMLSDDYCNFDVGIYFYNKRVYYHILSMFQFYNEINKEKIFEEHKIKSLLYLMIYKNIPQDLVRYCIKSYL